MPTNSPPSWTPKVGDLIYLNYRPISCGKIIEDLGELRPGSSFRRFMVRWLHGKIRQSEVGENEIKNFEHLVDDHERKFVRHAQTLEKLRSL